MGPWISSRGLQEALDDFVSILLFGMGAPGDFPVFFDFLTVAGFFSLYFPRIS